MSSAVFVNPGPLHQVHDDLANTVTQADSLSINLSSSRYYIPRAASQQLKTGGHPLGPLISQMSTSSAMVTNSDQLEPEKVSSLIFLLQYVPTS